MAKLILPIIIFGAAVLSVFYLVLPKYEDVRETQREMFTYDAALDQADEIIARKSELDQRYNSFTAEERLKIETFLPDRPDTISSIILMNTIARDNAVIIQDVNERADNNTLESALQAEGVNASTVSYDISADYPTLLNLLRSIEGSLSLIDVTRISFDTEGSEFTGSNFWDISLSARNYWVTD